MENKEGKKTNTKSKLWIIWIIVAFIGGAGATILLYFLILPIRENIESTNVNITTIFTGVIAFATIAYAVVTALLLWTNAKSLELTRKAILLTALVHEAEFVFKKGQKNSDGSASFGGLESALRHSLYKYMGKIMKFREEIEQALGMSSGSET